MRGFNYKKSVQSLSFLAYKSGGNLNKMKAIKLIWLADRLHLRKYGRSITGDEYYALPNGPVPSATRDVLESSNFIEDTATQYAAGYIEEIDKYNYKAIAEGNYNVFSQSDLDVLEKIFDVFNCYDHFALSEFSHEFPEWKKHESALKMKLSSRFRIETLDFFMNLNEKSGLFLDSEDDLNISKSIFEENSKIINVL